MKLLSSCLAFVFVEVCVAIGLGIAASGLSLPVALVSLAAGGAASILAWRATTDVPLRKAGLVDLVMLGVFTLVSLRAFLWVIYERGDELCVLSPNNLGDMSLHLNFIRYMASGVPFWPVSPIISEAPLTYPVGADLFNSILEILGGNTIRFLVWTGLGGAALTGYALWRWGGAFGIAAFLFNGGLAGFVFLRSFQLEDFQSEMVWKNLFLSMFVTQRGLLIALPAGLLLLTVWREAYFRSGKRILPFWLQGLFYAGMPLFNVHAFLFLSVILAGIFLARPAARRRLLAFVAGCFVPATLAVILVTGFFSTSSGLRLEPAWIMEGSGWAGWLWNFGLSLPMVLALAFLLTRIKDGEARCFVWTALLAFVFCCVVILTPWNWDNMKLMMWSWLVIAPYLWTKVIAPLPRVAQGAICLVLFFSGAVSLAGGLDGRHGYGIARRSEVDGWRHTLLNVPADARLACVPDYNHPVILLGRPVACGYEGHLWSHGLVYREKLDTLRSALAGNVDWRMAAPALGVEWLALRNTDYATTRPPGPLPSTGVGALYDLRPLLKQDASTPTPLQLQPQSVD